MISYKELYIELLRETEKAICILTDVQNRCEEMYADLPVEEDEDKP